MQKLHKEIGNIIEDNDHLTISKVADFIGCDRQELSNFINDGGISFRKLLRLSFILFPKNQQEVMSSWCLRLNTTESIKQSFEYASVTRNIELLRELIEKYRGEKDIMGKYVSVYSILYDFYTNEIGAKDLIWRLEKVGQLKGELAILANIIKCYNYYYVEKYHLMLETGKEAEASINKFGERRLFIKECYLHRIAEVLGHVSLHLNDIDSARYYATRIISADMCAKTVAGATYILGMTYLPEDEVKSINYLQARYEISKTLGEKDIEENARRDLDFAKLYLNVQLDADSDPILQRLQSNKGSEFELKLIKEAIFKQGEEDILVLLGAIARNTTEKLHECRKSFFKQSNYFFASLAAREIRKLGDRSEMLEEFIDFKIETKGDVEFEENFIRCFARIDNSYKSNSA
ncbi:AimR family lysis-lysogeny pheromone receptor [Peribacillus huizhouensis]|uniref:Transcriptional regulator n=1 Tax=Peribacillus huizhouensis TaxID=1501239 RepID=A0ABR6CRB6_9BACI|nr:AimR family lysis-lysogeny pheromone receptor [Peribacillus huizhouensis]MBA9027571.1 hypothetical protein [Peribacillus huizhouensis]